MANTITHKRSSTSSDTPSASDLSAGEIAINTADGKLFIKKSDDSIATFESGSLTPSGAQTSITSILNASLVVGRSDATEQIDFGTLNTIIFKAGGTNQIQLYDGSIRPITDNDVDLGASGKEFKDLYLDGSAIVDNIQNSGSMTNAGYLWLTSDNQTIYFGNNFEVNLRHVHNTGLLLNSDNVFQFRDADINIGSPADGDLDINADDEIELNSTLIDINGAVDISGNTDVAGTLTSVGNFDVNTDKFTVNATSGNTVIAGTLGVTGTITGDSLVCTNINTSGGIDVQNSDTTLTRASAGVIAVEGNEVLTSSTGATKGFATAMAIAL